MANRSDPRLVIVGDTKQARAAVGELDRELQGFDGKVKAAGGKIASAFGKTMLAAGIAGAVALTKGFLDGMSQEKAADKVAAQFGLDPAEQARLGKIAGDVYTDAFGESLGQVTGAAAAVDRAFQGLGEAEIEGLTEHALNFAETFDTDVQTAIDRAGMLMRSGLVADGEDAFDLLTAGMQELPVSIRDELLDATQEYSQFFGQLGISGEDAFALIVDAGERAGQFGVDKTGDALKELSIRATDMSTASVEAYEAAGLNAERMAARFLAGGDDARGALDDLVAGLQGIEDPVKRSNAAIALFGTPIEDLGTENIPAFLDSLGNMGDGLGDISTRAEDLGDTLNDNLSTRLESLKRRGLQGVTDFMTSNVLPVVDRVAAAFGEGGLGAAVSEIGTIFEEAWPKVQAALGNLLDDTLSWVSDNGPAVAEQFGVWVGAAVQWAIDAVPVLLEKGGELLDKLLDWVRDEGAPQLGDRMGEMIPKLTAWVLDAIPPLLVNLAKVMGKIGWWAVTDGIPALVSIGADLIGGLLRGLLGGVGEVLGAAVDFAADVGRTIANGVIGFVNTRVIDGLNDALDISWDPPGPIPRINLAPPFDIPHIPRLAQGGVAEVPTLALIGDAGPGNPEIVAPERKLEQVLTRVMAKAGGGGMNFYGPVTLGQGAAADLDWWARTRAVGV